MASHSKSKTNPQFVTDDVFEGGSGGNGVTFSGLDPVLGSLGVMIGLLKSIDATTNTYELINEWFLDPITNVESGFKANPRELGQLLGQLLGTLGGNALGLPQSDPAILGSWYPIQIKNNDGDYVPTGLYLVTIDNETEGSTAIGLGILRTWSVPIDTPVVDVNVWALLPAIVINSDGSFGLTFTDANSVNPISIGVAVEGSEGNSPIIDENGISFNGVKFSANINLAASPPFDVTLEVLALQLAGDAKPRNYSLADLEAITPQEILDTAANLFIGALSNRFPDQAEQILFMAPLFGLSQTIPNADPDSSVSLPILQWYDLFKIVNNGGDPAKPFIDWFNSITADPQLLSAWMTCLSGFLGFSSDKLKVSGNGDRNTPFQVSLLQVDIGQVNFTAASVVVDNGLRFFYPGLSFRLTPIGLADSGTVFIMESDLELAKFQLGGTPSVSLDLNFKINFSLENETENTPLINFQGYNVDKMFGGLSLGLISGSIVPYLELTNVIVPGQAEGVELADAANEFGTVNLLSPGQLAQVATVALSGQLQDLMGLNDNPTVLVKSIASLIGLTAPDSAGANWPTATLTPPFSVDGITNAIADPLNAWAKYYLDILEATEEIEGKLPFTYILQSFASLLQIGDTSIVVSGSGTPETPWLVGISIGDQTMPAYLTASNETINGNADNGLLLNLGFRFGPQLTISSVLIEPSLDLDALCLSFPKGESTTAKWFNSVSAQLKLPEGLSTPSVGGTVFSVSTAQLSGGWGQSNAWSWSMLVKEPTLQIGTADPVTGADLNFSEQSSLQDLVKESASTFGPFFANALGIFLLRTNTRVALLTSATFGLLTDFSQDDLFKESGLTWSGFTEIPLTSFSDPFGLLQQQIASNFSTADKAKSQIALLSWALSSAEKAPTITGTGTVLDPYLCPLPLGFDLPIWYDSSTEIIGIGLGRSDNFSYSSGTPAIAVNMLSQLRVIEYNLKSGAIVSSENAPSFNFQVTISNPAGNLVELGGELGSLGEAVLGFDLNIVNGSLQFKPIVTLIEAKLFGETEATDISLEDFLKPTFIAQSQQSFLNLLNRGIQFAIDEVKDQTLFQNAYNVLSLLGLALKRNPATAAGTDPYGINSSGWTGLLANPDTYIENQLLTFFETQENRTLLLEVFETIFDITIPDFPSQALDLFNGLDIVGPAEEFYPLYPQAVLEIASDPINSLTARFKALFDNTQALKKLSAELTKNINDLPPFGLLELTSTASGVVTLSLPSSNPFKIGANASGNENEAFLEISGSLALDFSNASLTATLNSYVPVLGLTLSNSFVATYKTGTVTLTPPTAMLIWGDGDRPAAAPLQLLPFNSNDFVNQVADIVPAYTLNIFLNAIFKSQLLEKYPVIQSVFDTLGIATKKVDDSNGALAENINWEMPSLLGLLFHPLDWLLSDSVLGTDGQFDISKLISKFSAFPSANYKPSSTDIDIAIGPNAAKNGINITGLPYGFFVEMSGDTALGAAVFSFGCAGIEIANNNGSLSNLLFSVSVSTDYQASFSGSLDLATTKGFPIFAEIGFDKTFALSITQGTPADPQLTLQLLPFTGWGKLAEGAATLAAAEVIQTVVPKILASLQEKGATTFVNALNTFGEKVPVGALVTSLIPIVSSGKSQTEITQELESTSLAWLKGLFESTQLNKTIEGVQAIFEAVPKVGTLIPTGGLLEYTPSDTLPLNLYFGLDDQNNLGLWVGLTVPKLKYLDISIGRTGIGVDLDTLSKLTFSFDASVIIPLDGINGPELFLKYDETTFFNLGFDPIGDITKSTKQSDLAVELVPVFFGKRLQQPNAGTLGEEVKQWLLAVIKNVLPRYVSVLVLNNESVLKWLQFNLFSPINSTTVELTPIELLVASTLVIESNEGEDKTIYSLNTIDKIKEITPLIFLGNLLQKLLESDVTLLTFDSGGSISIGENPNEAGAYGLRLAAPNFKIDALPNVVLQIGATDDSWIKNSWSQGADNKLLPGIQFYLPITTDPVTINFHEFNIILENVGFDIVGKNGQPIVDLARFKLGAIDPRVLLNIKFNESASPTIIFGGSLTLADMGVSLAPNQLTTKSNNPNDPSAGNSSNPIASNLLGSGTDSEDSKDDKNPPADPTFSAQVAYVDQLSVQLISGNGNGDEIIIPVQRAFGPLFVDSLGVGWDDKDEQKPLLDFIFTGNIGLAGLDVSLIGLEVGIPVKTPTDFSAYTLDLAGLDVSYKGGNVSISGGLLEQKEPFLQYTGAAVLKASTFSIMALGSYAQVPDSSGKNVTSLFIFGALDAPLGGVPAFFITGVAAGFGYNRSIKIPEVDKVMDFPLVSGVLNGTLTGSNDPANALAELANVVAPEVGQYWLAAGLKFKSFELINTAAVLFISFGKNFEIDLLGLSYASLPPELPKDSALAYFELAIKVSFKPSEGIISVEAQLTPNSFVLTKECKLTGGFAFFLWYKNITQTIGGKPVDIPAGQFVITLGGYHPQFQAPAYYPTVPRLGFQWIMDVSVGKVSITGGAYFAICPTAIMAGGYLKVLFEAGPLKAWLDAYANFLIEWKPFFFSVDIGITIGASFGFTVSGVSITIKAELGAKLHLEGPPINGQVEVDWYVISFTIPIGDKKTETNDANLKSWDAFANSFLPPNETPAATQKSLSRKKTKRTKVKAASASSNGQQVLKWNAGSGLQNSNDTENNGEDSNWVVSIMYYSFNVASAVPSSKVTVKGSTYSENGNPVGIRPLGYVNTLESPIEVIVTNNNAASDPIDLASRGMNLSADLNGAPAALWSKSGISTTQAPSGDDMIIKSVLMGLSMTADQYLALGEIPAFPIDRMKYTDGSDRLLPFYNKIRYKAPTTILDQDKVYTTIMKTIMSDGTDVVYNVDVISNRNAIYTALSSLTAAAISSTSGNQNFNTVLNQSTSFSIDAPTNPDLSVMASSANLILQAFPVLAAIDVYQNDGETIDPTPYTPPTTASLKALSSKYVPSPPVMQGVLRRYRVNSNIRAEQGSSSNQHKVVSGKWTSYTGFDKSGIRKRNSKLREKARTEIKNLFEGGAIVWKVDTQAAHTLNVNGNVNAIVHCFDKYHALQRIKILKDRTTYKLPNQTSQVAVEAHNPAEHAIVGWQENSMLTKINPVWSIGNGCLLKVQNTKRIRVNKRRDAQGTVEVSRLLANNLVMGENDALSQGWHQTALLSENPYVGVLVEGGTFDTVQVSLEINQLPLTLGKSKPIRTMSLKKKLLLIFEVSKSKLSAGSYVGVITYSGEESQRIVGVYSFDDLRKSPSAIYSGSSLNENALEIGQSDIKSTKVALKINAPKKPRGSAVKKIKIDEM